MILNTYKMLIPCVPFPFEVSVSASTLKYAIDKAIFQAKKCGLKPCTKRIIRKNLEFELTATRTI